MMMSTQAKEVAWRSREEKSVASPRAAEDRVASLWMALMIIDQGGRGVEGLERHRFQEERLQTENNQLKCLQLKKQLIVKR